MTESLSVIEAMASGRRAAEAIHHYFHNEPDKGHDVAGPLRALDENVVRSLNKSERQKMPTLPVEERIDNFAEVDLRFTQGRHAGKLCAA